MSSSKQQGLHDADSRISFLSLESTSPSSQTWGRKHSGGEASDDVGRGGTGTSSKHSSSRKPSRAEDEDLIKNVVMLLEMLGEDEVGELTSQEQGLLAMLTAGQPDQHQRGTFSTTSIARQRSRSKSPSGGRASPPVPSSSHHMRNGKTILNPEKYDEQNVIVVLKAILRTVSNETIPFELEVPPPFRP